jgi:NAD(P)-dependent dehydrogenase (short-subunit alcohol dehydrogenase family)
LSDKLTEGPGKLCPIKCDISKEEDILSAFEEVKKKLGGVDILVNNAGVVHQTLLSGTMFPQIITRTFSSVTICPQQL